MAPTFSELQQQADSPNLVRKTLRAVAFMAPMTAELPEAITDETGALTALPEDYWPVGIVTPDGYTYGADTTKEDVDALGYIGPVRSDITRVAKTVAFTALESERRHLAELIYGMDLSGVTQGANGEITFDEPELPIGAEYRLIIIGKDGTASNEWLRGRGYPRVKLAEFPEETWSATDPRQYPITLDVFTDDEYGTPVRHYIAGTGAQAAADALGYGQATAG